MVKEYTDDDGRVVCDMNVEGMPWYDRNALKVSDYRQSKPKPQKYQSGPAMTRSEAIRYTWYAVLAGLTVVAVFAVVWILFTLFAVNVWFR